MARPPYNAIMQTEPNLPNVAERLLDWYDHDHADLPWRGSRDPYAIWISEIMAQQTQLVTVIPYWERWMARFPDVQTLAAGPIDDVLKHWEGLGYYSRARNLFEAANTVVDEWDGELPTTAADLQTLKGIGRYTAAAIASICFEEAAPVVDGNVIRVLTRYRDISDDVTKSATKNRLWEVAAELISHERPGDYNQALMELGQKACVPKNPRCLICPIQGDCLGRQRGTLLERPVKPPRKKSPHYDVVAAVIWEEEIGRGRFLIAQRPFDKLLGGLWEFPGGKLEAGETFAQALVREIEEEMEISVAVPEGREPFTRVKHAYTHFKISLYAMHALYQGGEIKHTGVNDHAWVDFDDLDRYPFAVTDQKIIQALRG